MMLRQIDSKTVLAVWYMISRKNLSICFITLGCIYFIFIFMKRGYKTLCVPL